MFRRITLLAFMVLALVGGGGCMIIAVRDHDLQDRVIEIDGQKYVVDEEGHAHKMVE